MPNYVKLPFQFDGALLREDLAKVLGDEWIRHFNQQYYAGNWSVAALRSIGGCTKQIYPDPHSKEAFADTEILARCGYVREVLGAIKCETEAVRFMLLGAGARILEHRDYFMGFEDGCIRLHIPVITNKRVEFYLADELIEMRTGELWYLDFYQKHRVENNGEKDRIHLVIDCKVNDWLVELIK
ncbi:MAG: aspartyl/asparaginyl beta-hydroxylase domain-containing protein [Actinomycetota bacterium]